MNVEIGTEAAQFLGKEYINGIFVAVRDNITLMDMEHEGLETNLAAHFLGVLLLPDIMVQTHFKFLEISYYENVKNRLSISSNRISML
jgi:hypothetical protein